MLQSGDNMPQPLVIWYLPLKNLVSKSYLWNYSIGILKGRVSITGSYFLFILIKVLPLGVPHFAVAEHTFQEECSSHTIKFDDTIVLSTIFNYYPSQYSEPIETYKHRNNFKMKACDLIEYGILLFDRCHLSFSHAHSYVLPIWALQCPGIKSMSTYKYGLFSSRLLADTDSESLLCFIRINH